MTARGLVVLIVLALAAPLCACRGGAGHPVRVSLPRLDTDAWPAEAPECPEPDAISGDDGRAAVMLGLERIFDRVVVLANRATQGRAPAFARLTAVEANVRRRYRGTRGPGGRVQNVAVVATAGHVPLAPGEMAALMVDPEVERAVLAANRFQKTRTAFRLPGHTREIFWIEKLRVGAGPFRYDLKFASAVERMDLGDGRIVLRYDPVASSDTEGVSLYRGAALIEPAAGGSRVSEVVIFATPLNAPPPFDQLLRDLVYDTFRHRSTNLWVRAWRAGDRER